jgi:hypothetical protein
MTNYIKLKLFIIVNVLILNMTVLVNGQLDKFNLGVYGECSISLEECTKDSTGDLLIFFENNTGIKTIGASTGINFRWYLDDNSINIDGEKRCNIINNNFLQCDENFSDNDSNDCCFYIYRYENNSNDMNNTLKYGEYWSIEDKEGNTECIILFKDGSGLFGASLAEIGGELFPMQWRLEGDIIKFEETKFTDDDSKNFIFNVKIIDDNTILSERKKFFFTKESKIK